MSSDRRFDFLTRRQFAMLATASFAFAQGSRVAFANDPFRLGAVVPLTGAGATNGAGIAEAIRIGTDEVNQAGGINGRQIDLKIEDDQTRPDAAVLAAKKLIDINRVESIVGVWLTASMLAIKPLVDNADIPAFTLGNAPELEEPGKDNVWMFFSSNADNGRAYYQALKEAGYKRPAIMAYNNVSLGIGARAFKAAMEADGKSIDPIFYEPNQLSYKSELNKAIATKPDILILLGFAPDVTIILRELYQSGYKCDVIAPAFSFTQAVAKTLGPDVTANVSAMNKLLPEGKTYDNFAAAFKKKVGQDPDIFAAVAYDMVIVLALANTLAKYSNKKVTECVSAVTNPPGEEVNTFAAGRDLILKGKKIKYEGASSELLFGPKRVIKAKYGLYKYENGKDVLKAKINLP